MTVKEASKLAVGQQVEWKPDGMVGTVRETSYAAVKVEWNDGQWTLFPFQAENAPWRNLLHFSQRTVSDGN